MYVWPTDLPKMKTEIKIKYTGCGLISLTTERYLSIRTTSIAISTASDRRHTLVSDDLRFDVDNLQRVYHPKRFHREPNAEPSLKAFGFLRDYQ